MTTKHAPATPLPWTASRVHPDFPNCNVSYVDSADRNEAATCYCDDSKKNSAYIAHTSNAYPRLVEDGKALVQMARESDPSNVLFMDAVLRFEALLRELGEE